MYQGPVYCADMMEDRARVEEAARAVGQGRARHSGEEQLPSYSEAAGKYQSPVQVTVKELAQMQAQSKKPGKLSAVKRALKKNDPGEPAGGAASSSAADSSSSLSALKSILTGTS